MSVLGPAYTQLIPFSELAPGEAATIRTRAIEALLNDASQKLNIQRDKMVVRDLRPLTDLDYTYLDWRETTGATVDAYETMSTGTVGDMQWVGIFGVMDDPNNASCSALKFNVGGADRVIWMLQQLKPQDDMVGFAPSVIVIPQNTIYTISRYVRSINATSRLVLKGIIVEPRGRVISP